MNLVSIVAFNIGGSLLDRRGKWFLLWFLRLLFRNRNSSDSEMADLFAISLGLETVLVSTSSSEDHLLATEVLGVEVPRGEVSLSKSFFSGTLASFGKGSSSGRKSTSGFARTSVEEVVCVSSARSVGEFLADTFLRVVEVSWDEFGTVSGIRRQDTTFILLDMGWGLRRTEDIWKRNRGWTSREWTRLESGRRSSCWGYC